MNNYSLGIGEYKPLPAYMDLWREKVEIYRNIWAAERLIIDKYDLTVEERIAAIKKYIEESEDIEERAHIVGMGIAKDKVAKEVIKNYLGYLSDGVVNVVNIFQPKIICLGGGVSNAGEKILKAIRKAIKDYSFARFGR